MPRDLRTQADANVEIDDKPNPVPRITAAEHRDLLKSIVQSLNFLVEGSFLNGVINPNSSRVDIGKKRGFLLRCLSTNFIWSKSQRWLGNGRYDTERCFMGCRQ